MAEHFINPNWHVILIHYPLGLLTTGLIVELLGLVWRGRPALRVVGRWLILLGALLAIPTATVGIYAFRDVVAPGSEPVEARWQQVVQQSPWSEAQWEMMSDHVWLNAAATVIFVFVAVAWLASSEARRQGRLWYTILLLLALVGIGLLTAGAWHGGESVYRYGTAVALADAATDRAPGARPALESDDAAHDHAAHDHGALDAAATTQPAGAATTTQPGAAGQGHTHAAAAHEEQRSAAEQAIIYYVPPLELHVVLAGFAVALAAVALGLSIKRWDPALQPRADLAGGERRPGPGPAGPEPVTPIDIRDSFRPATPPGTPPTTPAPAPPPRVFPSRFWLLASLVAVLTAAAGVWSVGGLRWEQVTEAIEEATEPGHQRLLWHIVGGTTLIVVPLVLALVVWFSRRAKVVTWLLMALVLLAAAWQVWTGTLMIYDSHAGPLTGFGQATGTTTAPSVTAAEP